MGHTARLPTSEPKAAPHTPPVTHRHGAARTKQRGASIPYIERRHNPKRRAALPDQHRPHPTEHAGPTPPEPLPDPDNPDTPAGPNAQHPPSAPAEPETPNANPDHHNRDSAHHAENPRLSNPPVLLSTPPTRQSSAVVAAMGAQRNHRLALRPCNRRQPCSYSGLLRGPIEGLDEDFLRTLRD